MKVFLCESIHPKAYEALAQKAEIISDWERAGEVDALLDRILYIGKEQLDKMPNLKVIAVHGTGTDGLDLPEVRRRGIPGGLCAPSQCQRGGGVGRGPYPGPGPADCVRPPAHR